MSDPHDYPCTCALPDERPSRNWFDARFDDGPLRVFVDGDEVWDCCAALAGPGGFVLSYSKAWPNSDYCEHETGVRLVRRDGNVSVVRIYDRITA